MTTKYVINEKLMFVVAGEPQAPDRTEKILKEWADEQHRLPPQLVGFGGMIYEEITVGNWRYEPLINDSSLPAGARKAIRTIKSQLPLQGFILGHEIEIETRPKVEPKPWIVAPETPQPGQVPEFPEINVDWDKVGKVSLTVLKGLGITLGILAAVGGAVVGAFAVACGVDPCVIAVDEEGRWWKIYTWMEAPYEFSL